MTEQEIINKINSAKSVIEVFENVYDWKKMYKLFCKIHPDVCNLPGSDGAFTKLNGYKHDLSIGKKHSDDAGTITYALHQITVTGEPALIKRSFENYQKLMALKDASSVHFKKYIPTTGILVSESEILFTVDYRCIPLSALGTLPHAHVNWITSRMLEFAGWINQSGFCHAGINPDSIYIIPENHGMMCVSFYHMTDLDAGLKTVSGKYQHLYPIKTFDLKKATSNIDIELAKRTGIFLLGDTSGTGTKLRKTHNEEVIDFLQKPEYNTIESYKQYRSLLNKHFDTKQFNHLNI